MFDNKFWEAVNGKWMTDAVKMSAGSDNQDNKTDINYDNINTLDEPEGVDFFSMDYEASVDSMLHGGKPVLDRYNSNVSDEIIAGNGSLDKKIINKEIINKEILNKENINKQAAMCKIKESDYTPPKKKHSIDMNVFDEYMNERSINGYINAAKLLYNDNMPDSLRPVCRSILDKLPSLDDAVDKFKNVYTADISQFTEIYIPECLDLIAGYYEYEDANVSEEVLKKTKEEIGTTAASLNNALSDKINEIYNFASIEIMAQAKALEALMGTAGYVNPDNKII